MGGAKQTAAAAKDVVKVIENTEKETDVKASILAQGEPIPEPLRFAIYAPTQIAMGVEFALDVWAFLDDQRERVENIAARAGDWKAGIKTSPDDKRRFQRVVD
jgi:hypothetical protein